MNKQISVVLLGAGNRANCYASLSLTRPEALKIVGIVDPDPVRTEYMRELYHVPTENCFTSVEEFVAREKFADAVINGTQDSLHVKTSIPVLEKGYDLLLEKPFAINEAEMEELCRVADKHGNRVVICHLLRYTDFYGGIKQLVSSGEIGDVISIESSEHVTYHHVATSYVRGKWRSEKIGSAPMLLAKSCHDLDIMLWMMNHTRPLKVASFGGDMQFGKERKPRDAGTRCMLDCPMADSCIYSSKHNYLGKRWRLSVWRKFVDENHRDPTVEEKEQSLMTDNPYGKCVWDCERDGNVDHQTVSVVFESGATGTFSMIGGSARAERNIHIIGTKGEIKGTYEDFRFVLRKNDPAIRSGYTEKVFELDTSPDKTVVGGHIGGGDSKLVLDFLDYLNGNPPSFRCALLKDSVNSHKLGFIANRARKMGRILKFR